MTETVGSCLEVSPQGVSIGLDVEMAELLFAKNRALLSVTADLTNSALCTALQCSRWTQPYFAQPWLLPRAGASMGAGVTLSSLGPLVSLNLGHIHSLSITLMTLRV